MSKLHSLHFILINSHLTSLIYSPYILFKDFSHLFSIFFILLLILHFFLFFILHSYFVLWFLNCRPSRDAPSDSFRVSFDGWCPSWMHIEGVDPFLFACFVRDLLLISLTQSRKHLRDFAAHRNNFFMILPRKSRRHPKSVKKALRCQISKKKRQLMFFNVLSVSRDGSFYGCDVVPPASHSTHLAVLPLLQFVWAVFFFRGCRRSIVKQLEQYKGGAPTHSLICYMVCPSIILISQPTQNAATIRNKKRDTAVVRQATTTDITREKAWFFLRFTY